MKTYDAAEIVAFPQHAIKAAKRPVTIESIIGCCPN